MSAMTSCSNKSPGLHRPSSPRNSSSRWRSISPSAISTMSLIETSPLYGARHRSAHTVNAQTDNIVSNITSAHSERPHTSAWP